MAKASRAARGAASGGQTATVDSTANRCERGQFRQRHRCDSASRAPGRVACGEGEQAWVRKHWTDTAPPYGREKEGTSWWEATAPVPLGETVITTIRLSLTCRRFYAAEAALDGISLLTVQIYGSTTPQLYKFMFSDTFHRPDLWFHYSACRTRTAGTHKRSCPSSPRRLVW